MAYVYQFMKFEGEMTADLDGCSCCDCEVPLAFFADSILGDKWLCAVCATTNISSSSTPDARLLAQVANHLKDWIGARLGVPESQPPTREE